MSKSIAKRLKVQMDARIKKLEEDLEQREKERQMEYLKPRELKDGYLYRILARNADYGVWLEDKGTFLISRFKFGDNFLFEEVHYDLSESFGTAKPLMEVEKCPLNLDDDKLLEYLNKFNDL